MRGRQVVPSPLNEPRLPVARRNGQRCTPSFTKGSLSVNIGMGKPGLAFMMGVASGMPGTQAEATGG